MNKLIQQKQLAQLISAHFKEIIRHPAVIFWGIIFPILMALGLGIAFTRQTDIIRHVAVIENNPAFTENANNELLIHAFLEKHADKIEPSGDKPHQYKITLVDEKLGNTTFLFEKTTWRHAMVLLKRGNLGIIMNEKKDRIEYHFDPLNTDAHFSYLKLSKIFGQNGVPVEENLESVHPLTIHGTRYIDFLVPGLMAMGIMMSCMWGMSYGMIDKRSKKLLRRMVATPMKKSYFLISLMTVRITMNLIESTLLFIFAWLVFHITIEGSIAGLFAIFIAGNIAFGGIAIFISCRTANTEIGNGLVNAVVMPMMVLSGVFFSYHNFPDWSIPFIQKLPLTLLADGLRSIFIEGAGYSEVFLPTAILLSIGIFFFSAGLRFFKWH
ncbi:MAG: ABC transporter permease [Desulfobacteraceae bacterium]|nr:ABC transporter permease [Desulfobacteraceae bacterium]MBC2757218.1 ABC transporter permease [Desulfobacteraceae bacterium]